MDAIVSYLDRSACHRSKLILRDQNPWIKAYATNTITLKTKSYLALNI